MPRSIAILWSDGLPSFLVPDIVYSLLFLTAAAHSARGTVCAVVFSQFLFFLTGEVKAQRLELFPHFIEGLLAEVSNLQHLLLRLVDQIVHGIDSGTLQAVERPYG